MPVGLPPVPTQDWEAHQNDQFERAGQDALASIASVKSAQDAADQAAEQDFTQRAQAQVQTALAPHREAVQTASFTQQAQDQVRALTRSVPTVSVPVSRADTYPGDQGSAPPPPGAPAGELQDYARQAAARAGIDPETFVRQIQQESGFRPDARNPSGATGIAQIVPSAHPNVDPTDPHASLDYAANWMGQLTKQYGGDKAKALAAYNAGPGNVEKYGGVPPFEETQRYVRTILGPQNGGDPSGAGAPAASGRNADIAPQTSAGAGSRVEAVGQFEQGLPAEDAYSICGPVAALAFAQDNGRNPDLGEARRLAKQVGWTSQGGMNGVANEAKLLQQMGVAAKLDTNPDFGHIAEDASSGNPVILSTPVHYYFVNGYNKETGQLHVGKTGEARKGGGSWMSAQQIATLDGGINGALFVDNPQSPAPSVAATPADEGGAVGGSWAPQTVRVPGTGLDQPANPDLLGAAGAVQQFPAQVMRAGAAPTASTSGLDTLADYGAAAPLGPVARGLERIATHGLAASQESYQRMQSDLVQADPTGGYAAGAVNAATNLGSDPLVLAGGLGGLGGRVGVATTVGGGVAGGVAAAFAPPTREPWMSDDTYARLVREHAASYVEGGANLGAMAGLPASMAAPAVGRAIERAAPAVREGVDMLKTGAREMGAAATEAGIVPGATIGPTSRYEPPPEDFAAHMQAAKDAAAGGERYTPPTPPAAKTSIRDMEAFYAEREAAARNAEPPATRLLGDPSAPDAPIHEYTGDAGIEGLPEAPIEAPRPGSPGASRVVAARVPSAPVDPGTPAPELPGARQSRLPGEAGAIPPSVAEAAAVEPTSRPVFAQFWNRARNVIESQGPSGKQLGGMLREWRDTSEKMAGDWTTQLQTVRKLDASDFRQFVAVAEGKLEPKSPLMQRALDEWNTVRTAVYERAKAGEIPIGFQENYFPHVFEPGTFKGKGWTDAIDHLVTSGQADTREEAAQLIRMAQGAVRDRRYGNLEAERTLDLPFFKRTKDVLFGQGGYLEAAANRIAQVETFGKKDATALQLIDRVGQEGGDSTAVKSLYDISVGATKYGELQSQITGALRGANTVASLGLSAITNAGQTVNTLTVAGLGPTARNIRSVLRDPVAKEYAVRAGVTLDNVVQDIREGTGLASRALGKITAPGFATVEKFNRTLALHAGISYAEDLAAAAARGAPDARAALGRLGLDGAAIAERGALTEAERMDAGRRMVERTQFKVDPQDLPGWASSPLGKLVTQFKSFSYNQSAFMAREILEPAVKRGDLRPLARFMVAGLVAGGVTTEAKNLIQGRESEQDPTKRIIQYYNAAGGLGLAGDALRIAGGVTNINAGNLPAERVQSQAVSTLLGPTVGKGAEIVGGLAQASRGNPVPLARTALRQIPIVGGALQNWFTPYAPRKEPASSAPVGRSSTKPPAPPKAPSPPKPPRR